MSADEDSGGRLARLAEAFDRLELGPMEISAFAVKLKGLCAAGVITVPEKNLATTSLGMLTLVMARRFGEKP